MSNGGIRPAIFTTLVARKLKRATSYQHSIRILLSRSAAEPDSMGSVHRFWGALVLLLEPISAQVLVAIGPTRRGDTIELQIHTDDGLLDAERWVVGLNERSAWTAELAESRDLACFPLALWDGGTLQRTATVAYVSHRDGGVRWLRSRVLPGPSVETAPPPWTEDDAHFPTALFSEDWEGRYEEVPALGVDVYVPAAIERRVRFEVQLARQPDKAVRQSFMSQLLFECLPLLDAGHAYVWLVRVDHRDSIAIEILGDQLANDASLQDRVGALLQQAEHVTAVRRCGVICDVATGNLPHYEGVLGEARGIQWEVEPGVLLLMALSIRSDGWGWAGNTWAGEAWIEHLSYRQLRELRRYEFVDPDGPPQDTGELRGHEFVDPERPLHATSGEVPRLHLVATAGVALPSGEVPLPQRLDSRPRIVADAQQEHDGSFSSLIAHIAAHGVMTEEEAVRLAGSARAYRRFVRKLDEIVVDLPFRLEVVSSGGRKRYIRR